MAGGSAGQGTEEGTAGAEGRAEGRAAHGKFEGGSGLRVGRAKAGQA
jgi:hypothetical protein